MTTLLDLRNVVGPGPRHKAENSQVSAYVLRKRANHRRFLFLVKSSEAYSSPDGHLVSILYPNLAVPFERLRYYPALTPLNQRVRIHCTCPAWKFTGPAYLSTREKYRLPESKYVENRPANIRDPEEQNYVCKHVVRVVQHIRFWNFTRLLRAFAIQAGPSPNRSKASSLETLYPIIGGALNRAGYLDDQIEDVITSLTDENAEEVLDTYGLICADRETRHASL